MADEARRKSDKANGKRVTEFLHVCQTNILTAITRGVYETIVPLHNIDEDDRKTVTYKLQKLGYAVRSCMRTGGMSIEWSAAGKMR
jgi:hypothetical protein